MALSRHYLLFHRILNKPPSYDSYTVMTLTIRRIMTLTPSYDSYKFVEQPSFNPPDIREYKWLSKLNVQTNMQSMILPPVK